MSEFVKYVLWELKRYFPLVLLGGLCVLAALWIPVYYRRRKHGTKAEFPWKKALLIICFVGYLLMVLFATTFRTSGIRRQVNPHLFRAWREALNLWSQQRWLNVLLNIGMFVPMGFLLPLISGKCRKWYVTIPVGFAVSGSIELIQLAAMRGVCDVDDLFCNTLGCVMGYFAVMVFLSAQNEKGKRLKPALAYTGLTLIALGAVGSVFLSYHMQEFGNLPDAPAYTIDTKGVVWSLECGFPEMRPKAPVYQAKPRSRAECDAFSEEFKKIIPTVFEDISYYQEAAYYMDHGNGDGAHFLFVNYLDQGYEYTAIYDDEPVWGKFDRETVLKLLEKYPLQIPETAEFTAEEEGWHQFSLARQIIGTELFDGTLRVRIAQDGSVREIENGLLSYVYYGDGDVISPEEAYARLCAGKFQNGDFFEMKNPSQLMVLSCDLEYRVDTKGFYQPVYIFAVQSPDGDYQSRILIPALK